MRSLQRNALISKELVCLAEEAQSIPVDSKGLGSRSKSLAYSKISKKKPLKTSEKGFGVHSLELFPAKARSF